ncbi:unnamed protein product [Brassica oleracea]
MGSKRKKGDEMITDSRFSKAHTDPRFRRLPRRESKVTIDSRFKGVLTDKASAPVDKRGKRRRRGSAKDSLKEYYRIEEDDKKQKQKRKEDSEEEGESGDDGSEGEEKLMALEAEEQSSEEESDDELKSEEKILPLELASSDKESDENSESEDEDVLEEEVDTDVDDEDMYEDDEPEVAEEEIASIQKETHRLAIVNMDWKHVTAKDLYVVFNSFLPKDGRLLSVAVYPSEFGLERMKEEEIHGPAIGGDNVDNSDEDDDGDEDKDLINESIRDYEKSRLRYYFAVAECDSSATADHLYKSCDGIEFERSSNKLDLRFIPDSMEFKHPPRDIATEAPATYQGLDFQSRALQMSRVNFAWDEDEPHRVRTLNQRFNPDQLAELELKEFLASDDSESDDDDGGDDDDEEKRKEKYLALMESGDVDSDKDEDEENDQDMVVEFNTGLEDLSNKFREKKEEKPETVWEAQLRKMQEKKKARRMQKKDEDDDSPDDDDDDSSDDEDDYNVDDHKKKKKMMMKNKNKKGLEEKLAADERSRAELELILADENGGDGKGLKGYNIKRKSKKRSKEMAEEKIPSADPEDSRFSAAITDPNYALDPTNPQFKRSATYVKQLTQKQKEDPRNQEEQVKDVETKKASTKDGTEGSSKKRSFAESATVKSLKLKMQQKGSEKKKEGTADLAQRLKKKARALSNK